MQHLHDPQCHDDLLNYRLKRLVSLGGAPAIRLCEGRFGISRSEWHLVAALVEAGPMSPSELARVAHFEAGRVSAALRRLTAKKLVERHVLADDRRRVVVGASAEGRRLHALLWPELAAINRRLMAALDADEAETLDRCLDKLTATAQRIYDEGGGVDVRADRRLGGSRRFWSEAID
ncbi:MAG TPA: MarR family transcriptional regulator [Caldimonas sp.]|jgi:DNA-binding MarR family transcriptional regulator|nr:MarR family transcriptional regulator [Caldimonas sp.]HEX2543169.1 MarR family transcriptional regulator [Caldimonas sp.]